MRHIVKEVLRQAGFDSEFVRVHSKTVSSMYARNRIVYPKFDASGLAVYDLPTDPDGLVETAKSIRTGLANRERQSRSEKPCTACYVMHAGECW